MSLGIRTDFGFRRSVLYREEFWKYLVHSYLSPFLGTYLHACDFVYSDPPLPFWYIFSLLFFTFPYMFCPFAYPLLASIHPSLYVTSHIHPCYWSSLGRSVGHSMS